MTVEWIRENLSDYLFEDDEIIIESRDGYPIRMVSVQGFSDLFSDVEEITFDNLIEKDKNENYGYSSFFEELKEKGILI